MTIPNSNMEEEFIKILKKEPKSACICDKTQNNYPIHYTVRYGFYNLTKILIEDYNICVNVKNIYGNTPLYEAIKVANLEITMLLLDKGANINSKNFWSKNPLEYARERKIIFSEAKENAHNSPETRRQNEILYENTSKIIKILKEKLSENIEVQKQNELKNKFNDSKNNYFVTTFGSIGVKTYFMNLSAISNINEDVVILESFPSNKENIPPATAEYQLLNTGLQRSINYSENILNQRNSLQITSSDNSNMANNRKRAFGSIEECSDNPQTLKKPRLENTGNHSENILAKRNPLQNKIIGKY
jgi:hypothetical protein